MKQKGKKRSKKKDLDMMKGKKKKGRMKKGLMVVPFLLFLGWATTAQGQTATDTPTETPTIVPPTASRTPSPTRSPVPTRTTTVSPLPTNSPTPNATPGGQGVVSHVTALELDNLRQMLIGPTPDSAAPGQTKRCRIFFYDSSMYVICGSNEIYKVVTVTP